jgi:RNA polymerase sigma-70 factor (ECF subfamily)
MQQTLNNAQAHNGKSSANQLVSTYSPIRTRGEFTRQVREHRPKLIKTAQHFTDDPEEVEDIVQQALLRAYEYLKRGEAYTVHSSAFRKEKGIQKGRTKRGTVVEILKPGPWLHTITRNVGKNYYNKKKKEANERKKTKKEIEMEEGPESEQPEKAFLLKEYYQELHDLVERLPPHLRAPIKLLFKEEQEYSYQEIAEKLDCPLGTVKSHISRGLDMIRDVLTDQREVVNGKIGRKKRLPKTPIDISTAASVMKG